VRACLVEFSDLQDTYRITWSRFDLVTVSANMPDEEPSVLRFLERSMYQPQLLFGSDDTAALQAAFDPAWQSAVPYTVVLASGKVIYKTIGSVDLLEMRRKILAAMPSDIYVQQILGCRRLVTQVKRHRERSRA